MGGRRQGLRPLPLRGNRLPPLCDKSPRVFWQAILRSGFCWPTLADMKTIHDLSRDPAESARLVLVIPGHPRPKQSVRAFGRRFVPVTKAQPLTRAWARAVFNVASAAKLERGGALPAGPLSVSVEFRFPCTDRRRWGTLHTMRPDADNLCKLLGDELARAGLIADDSAIQWGRVVKVWSAPAGAGASVMLEIGAAVDAGARAKENPPGWLLPGGR